MTRKGKIARLPKHIREVLNQRLQNGQFGNCLLDWLNHLPECEEMLEDHFESQPITKQNLSEWKQGGYKDWLRNEEVRQQVQRLAEQAEDLENEAGAMSIADRLGTVLSMQLLAMIEQLDSIAEPREKWARLREILRELHHLRREDHRARRLRMTEEQWRMKCDQENKRQKEAEAEKLIKLQGAMENKLMLSRMKGRGHEAGKWVDWELRVHYGLPLPRWWKNPTTAEEWSELMMPFWEEQVAERREEAAARANKSKVQSPASKVDESTAGEDGESSVEDDEGKADGLDDKIEDGDGSDACPASESVQPSPTKSDLVKVDGQGAGNGAGSKFEDQSPGGCS